MRVTARSANDYRARSPELRKPRSKGSTPSSFMMPSPVGRMARGRAAVLQRDIGVTPRDQVTNREPLIKRVQRVTHLRSVPDEGALDFRVGDLALAPLESRLSIPSPSAWSGYAICHMRWLGASTLTVPFKNSSSRSDVLKNALLRTILREDHC